MADRHLMEQAIEEIQTLRLANAKLSAYQSHTERLLGLFEGGPPEKGFSTMGEDVAWALRKRIEEIAASTTKLDENQSTKVPS